MIKTLREKLNRVMTFFLCMALLISMIPQLGSRVYAETQKPEVIGSGFLGLAHEVNTLSAAVVYLGGKTWYVIGYNGNGVASGSNEIVLFMDEILTTAPYDDDSLVYKDCILQTTMDNYVKNTFTDGEKQAVIPRWLAAMNIDNYMDEYWWRNNFKSVDEVPYEGTTALA